MVDGDIERTKLELDQQRVEIEKARLELERSFSKRYFTPLLGILGAVVAGSFALGQVWVASIQRDREVRAAEIQREKDTEIAASERERRWKLDIADFVFRNRELIFATTESEDQGRIFRVIAVTFPANISAIVLKDLRQSLPEEQQALLDESQKLVVARQRMSPAEVGIDRFGSDYKDFQVSCVEECSESCRTEPTCQAFSFNRTAKQCWLKNAVPLRTDNPNFISGVKVMN